MKKLMILMTLLTLTTGALAHSVATTDVVDIKKYIGKWYAVSSLPLFFSRGCSSQTAEYDIIDEKTISVKNTCIKPGKKKLIWGKAVVTNPATNSELYVQFNTWWARWFNVKGDYNIVKIDPNYDYVMVGGNNRKSLWIMSRRPYMPEDIYEQYVNYAKELHFPVQNLVKSTY
jgi:apolipoprotein D and lipocalin family protein